MFVLTHHARPPLRMQGDTTFHFVTDGIHEALARAREAAGGMDVRIVTPAVEADDPPHPKNSNKQGDPMRLAGKSVLITGAASGIGRATALMCAREGAYVTVTDLDKSGAETVADRIRSGDGSANAEALDVRIEADWERVIHDTVKRCGQLDVMVANAGISFAKTVALECAGDGIRVNTVHPAGVKTPMWEGMRFFEDLKREHGGVAGAWEALERSSPLGRFATPEEIAAGILYLSSEEASYVTGTELVIDGGYTA